MKTEYNIEIQRPLGQRRSRKLIIVVTDSEGIEIFRDEDNLNQEKVRTRIVQRVANLTGDPEDTIAQRLLTGLEQLTPPVTPSNSGAPGGQTVPYPYQATPGGLIWNKETPEPFGATSDLNRSVVILSPSHRAQTINWVANSGAVSALF